MLPPLSERQAWSRRETRPPSHTGPRRAYLAPRGGFAPSARLSGKAGGAAPFRASWGPDAGDGVAEPLLLGFGQIVAGAQLQDLDGGVHAAVAADHDDGRSAAVRIRQTAGRPWAKDVSRTKSSPPRTRPARRAAPASSTRTFAETVQGQPMSASSLRPIPSHDQPASGRRHSTRQPFPFWLDNSNVPPWAARMRRAAAKPRPTPPGLVV